MTTLTKIGNSQGIRIPKPLIKPVNNTSTVDKKTSQDISKMLVRMFEL